MFGPPVIVLCRTVRQVAPIPAIDLNRAEEPGVDIQRCLLCCRVVQLAVK